MESLHASEPSTASGGMAPTSLLVGFLAAGVGALLWGAVSFFTGYEVGYLAWGIGGMVGLAMARFGGRGATSAVVAAVLSVAGIAGGKLLGTSFVVERGFRELGEATFTKELHQELAGDAADLALLGEDAGDQEHRLFMVEHRYTGVDSPENVTEEELQAFLSTDAPDLRALHANRTSYPDWFAERTAQSRRAFDEEFSIVQANLDELNGIDVLFVFLGVSTAFGIVRRASPEGPTPAAEQESRKAA